MSLSIDAASDSAHADNRIRKSRHRVPTSCTVCRKKKVKCDKSRPFCGACIRGSTCNACHYENQPWNVATDIKRLNQQIIQLKQQNAELKSLVADYEIQINQLIEERVGNSRSDKYHSAELFRMKNDGFTPVFSNKLKLQPTNEEDDTIRDLVKDFDVLVIKENKLMHFGSTSFMSLASNDPLISDVFGKFLACQHEMYTKMNCYDTTIDTNDPSAALLSTHSSETMSQVINPINSILPPKNIFNSLLLRFFEKCYLFMPYVDKDIFYNQLSAVLKYSDHGDCYFIIPIRAQLVTVAMTLIFLRFAYLSLPLDKVQEDSKNKNIDDLTMEIYARGVHISPLFIEHAKNCVTNSSAFRKANLQTVQTLLFLKFYKLQSPEDGDSSIDAVISLSVIVQMAKLIGLNRDPDNFEIVDNVKIKHVWRKVWYKLVEIDAFNALQWGCELLIPDDNSFDTELPYISTELQRAGTMNPAEPTIVRHIGILHQLASLLRKVATIMLATKKNPKRSEIDACIAELELFQKQKVRPFKAFIEIATLADHGSKFSFNDRCERAKESLLKLMATLVHYILNYISLLTTIPENKVLRRKYYQKTIESSLSIFKFSFDYFKHPSYVFGDDLKKLITPNVVVAAQRSFQMICILVVRHNEYFDDDFDLRKVLSHELVSWLTCNKEEIAELSGVDIRDTSQIMSFQLYAYMEEVYKFASAMSDQYFQLWKFCKLITMFIVYLIEKRPAYKDFSNKLHNKRKKAVESNNSTVFPDEAHSDPDVNFRKNMFNKGDLSGNLMQEFDNFVEEQLQQLDMYADTKKSTNWAALVDEAGQLKYDYFNPILNVNEPQEDEDYYSDNENNEIGSFSNIPKVVDNYTGPDQVKGLSTVAQFSNNQGHNNQDQNMVPLGVPNSEPNVYNTASLGNVSHSPSIVTPGTIPDLQLANFLDSALVNEEIDKQFRNFQDTAADTIPSSNTDSSNSMKNYEDSTSDPNTTSTGSTSENGPPLFELNYGIQLARMMFGDS